ALQIGTECLLRPYELYNQEGWPQPNDLGAHEGSWPVLRVDIQEAHPCAVWLGGWLPTSEQWEKAAGRFESGGTEGPFDGAEPFAPDDLAIGRDGQPDDKGNLHPVGPLP